MGFLHGTKSNDLLIMSRRLPLSRLASTFQLPRTRADPTRIRLINDELQRGQDARQPYDRSEERQRFSEGPDFRSVAR